MPRWAKPMAPVLMSLPDARGRIPPASRDQRPPTPGGAAWRAVELPLPSGSGWNVIVRNTFIDCERQEEEPRRLRRSSSAPPLLLPERTPRDTAPESGGRCVDSEGEAQQGIGEADTEASLPLRSPSLEARGEERISAAAALLPALGVSAPAWAAWPRAAARRPTARSGQARRQEWEGDDVLGKVEGLKSPSGKPPSSQGAERRTTVLFRKMPFLLTRDAFVELLNSHGFRGKFDMVYVPMDFKLNQALGYAFVNAVDSETAVRLLRVFEGFQAWPVKSQKPCVVCWSSRQGLESNVRVYRNLTVMKQAAPEAWKPALFSGGSQVPLPEPTRRTKRYWKQHWKQHGSVGSGVARL